MAYHQCGPHRVTLVTILGLLCICHLTVSGLPSLVEVLAYISLELGSVLQSDYVYFLPLATFTLFMIFCESLFSTTNVGERDHLT